MARRGFIVRCRQVRPAVLIVAKVAGSYGMSAYRQALLLFVLLSSVPALAKDHYVQRLNLVGAGRKTGNTADGLFDHNAGIFADPFLPRGGAAMLANPADLHRLVGYQLGEDSPAVGSGLDLRREFNIDPGPVDFYGNPLPKEGGLSIGAHEPRRGHAN